MQLFCPACNAAYFGETRCPRCAGLLLMPHEVASNAPPEPEPPPVQASPTAIGRITMGTILALGFYLGVRKLLTGSILAALQVGAGEWWLSLQGLTAIYSVQVVAVLFGALIAAAGRPYGYSLGFMVGGICGGLYLGFELLAGAPAQTLVLYLQPPVLAFLGLVAGAVGSRVWQPAAILNLPLPTGSKLSSLQLGDDLAEEQPRPTWWIRVLAGAAIIVIGTAFADPVAVVPCSRTRADFSTLRASARPSTSPGSSPRSLPSAAACSPRPARAPAFVTGCSPGCSARLACSPPARARAKHCRRSTTSWLAAPSSNCRSRAPPCWGTLGTAIASLGVLGGWLGGTLFPPMAPPHMRKRLQVGLD